MIDLKGATEIVGFFHPKLCPDSLKYGSCSSSDCTLAHLFGTQRTAKKTDYQSFYIDKPNLTSHSDNRQFGYGKQLFRTDEKHGHFTGINGSRNLNFNCQDFNPSNNQRKEFSYSKHAFPPLARINEDRISEICSSIKQMQKSIEFLMQCATNNSHQVLRNQQSLYMDNNQFHNAGQSQLMHNVNPTRNEAKN